MREALKIEIPSYITHVQLSKHRRRKYYTIKSKNIPKKYKTDKYHFNKKGILVEKLTGEPVIANPRVAGTPRLKKINGQEIYTGNISPIIRSKIVREMKNFYRDYFPLNHKIRDICKIRLDIYNAVGDGNQDLDNMSWIIVKVIQDVLVETKILPEDNITVINGYEVEFHPVASEDDRKLVVTLLVEETQEIAV
jgi:hypothetical protein